MLNTCAAALAVGLVLCLSKAVHSNPGGPPIGVCTSLTPSHPASQATDAPGGFYIYTELLNDGNGGSYDPNQSYDVLLGSPSGDPFLGFLIQARNPTNDALLGTFTIMDTANFQFLGCSGNGQATVVHRNNNMKTSAAFTWTSPSTAGTVEFRYTVVTGYRESYYANLNAADNRPPVSFFPTQLGDHLFNFGIPEGCTGTACNYSVGLSTNMDNMDYLDVYLDGEASGWIAIGFSTDMTMGNDDVLGCRVNSNSNTVTAVDTRNPLGTDPNVVDDVQSDLTMHFGNFQNGRITCSFSRLIEGDGSNQDFNLNNSFVLFYGRRLTAQGTDTNLASHRADSMNPIRSTAIFNPTTDAFAAPVVNQTCPPPPGDDATYSFQFNTPSDSYYLAARVNPFDSTYVDIRLEGDAQGWVGVGFSDEREMRNDDVLGCIRDGDDVFVVDTFNPSTRYGSNTRDPTQDGVCANTTSFINGRISCTFSRLIQAEGDSDRDLNQDWYLFFATSNEGGSSAGALPRHSTTPDISGSRVNIVEDDSAALSDFPRAELLKVHGILMIVTWPLMVVVAIFFAAWMKPALPNGEWFQVHRVFMVVALFVGAAGFIFAFVANADNATPGLISFACGENRTHFALGIIVFLLQIANPIIAIFRCSPKGKNRWIFNLTHGNLIGLGAELLALTNVGLGIALFEAGGCNVLEASQYTILWVYVGFVIFLLILQVVLFIIFTLLAFTAEPEKRAGLVPSMMKYFFTVKQEEKPLEMSDPTSKPEKPSNDPPPRKPPSEDSPLRWVFFVVFLPVTLALMLACIVLIIIN